MMGLSIPMYSLLISILFIGLSFPLTRMIFLCIASFSSVGILRSKKDRPIRSSLRYHKCLRNFSMAAAAITSLTVEYCCSCFKTWYHSLVRMQPWKQKSKPGCSHQQCQIKEIHVTHFLLFMWVWKPYGFYASMLCQTCKLWKNIEDGHCADH